MKIKLLPAICLVVFFWGCLSESASAQTRATSRGTSTKRYDAQDWGRFTHYPYVYYEQNFKPVESYRSADDLYYRYSRPMQVPMYNPYWQNFYPVPRKFHEGKHFVLDVF